ncbi:uncharacterized protein LOC144425170 [Styela clava]
MPPRRSNISPQQRTILTRSMSLNFQNEGNDTCFRGVDEKKFGDEPPRFEVHHVYVASKCGRREKRAGMDIGKAAIRKPKNKLPPARIDSMKNLFSRLVMDEQSKSISPDDQCKYCRSMKSFLYENNSDQPPDGCCSCVHSISRGIVQLVQKPSISKCPLEEPVCQTIVKETEHTNARGPFPCKVSNPQTGLGWRLKGGPIHAVTGENSGLHYWIITGSMTGRRVFVFGFEDGSEWKYATVNPHRRRIAFRPNNNHPASIEVDSNAPIDDHRAFYLQGSPGSGNHVHLIPAIDESLAVSINNNSRRRTLGLVDGVRNAHSWVVDE